MTDYEKIKTACVKANPKLIVYERNRQWKLNNKEKVRLQSIRYYEKNKSRILHKHRLYANTDGNLRKYGITMKEFEAFFAKQNGVCAICKEVESSKISGKLKRLSVDHDHKTGKVRGLLCNSCNRGIGYLRDSHVIAAEACNYLKQSEETLAFIASLL